MGRVGVLDYGICNVASVCNALKYVGADVDLVSDCDAIKNYSHVVLPGVGSFPRGMENLETRKFIDPLRRAVEAGKPLIGFCLGMQLLAEVGEEHRLTSGLGFFADKIIKMSQIHSGIRLPHVGWNSVEVMSDSTLLRGVPNLTDFYFVHSFAYASSDANYVKGVVKYGLKYPAVIEHENLFGVQFHPEKSQKHGLKLLKNFIQIG